MKIIDLFSGVGGLSLGFEMAGFQTALAIDLWDDAIQTFNFNHKKKVGFVTDITEFNNTLINDLDKKSITGIVGGPPCQGFSSAGLSDITEKGKHVNQNRNQLYLEFYKTVKKINPSFFVIENVKGLLSSSSGAFVDDITKRFGHLGYEVSYQILNAKDFGVPQSRQRVFFVGLKNKQFSFPDPHKNFITTFDALSDLPINPDTVNYYSSKASNPYQKLMRSANEKIIHNHENTNHSDKTIQVISKIPDGGSIKSLDNEYWHIRKYNKAFQRMNSMDVSHTVDTGHRNYFHYKANRIPTVRENARLQSFPDNFIFTGSKTSQYKQVGNAVPPLLAFALAKKIVNNIKT